jgi:hypothetical protein
VKARCVGRVEKGFQVSKRLIRFLPQSFTLYQFLERSACCFSNAMQTRAIRVQSNITAHTSWKDSVNDASKPSRHPLGSLLSSSKPFRIRRIFSGPEASWPNRSHSLSLRAVW